MGKFVVVLLLLICFPAVAGAGVWQMNGALTAKVDATYLSVKSASDITSSGLTVTCWPGSRTMRVWVRDFSEVAVHEVVIWKTDRVSDYFLVYTRHIAAPDPQLDKMKTRKLLKALIRGNIVTFTSKSDSDRQLLTATYSLKGSSKAIKSLPSSCVREYLTSERIGPSLVNVPNVSEPSSKRIGRRRGSSQPSYRNVRSFGGSGSHRSGK